MFYGRDALSRITGNGAQVGTETSLTPTRLHHAAVVALIGRDIVNGKYAVGEILPFEEEFVEKLDVGRGVIREALRVLAAKGLVETRPKRGTQVLPSSMWQLLDPEILFWRIGQNFDPKFLRDLTDLRSIIEPAACALAAERASDPELQLIAALARELNYAKDDEFAFIEADLQFHRAIIQSTHNDIFVQIGVAIESVLRLSVEVTVGIGHGRRIAEHEKVAKAVCDRQVSKSRIAMAELIELNVLDIASILGPAFSNPKN
ncbi:MAG: FadR family transcriptional regulator [Candidatus Nanopelagicaceae bacterium]|nr:FadR family transcriptional regulator [Candidatus Nanopelagicaceae bacterium]